jgi:hypothetical protein
MAYEFNYDRLMDEFGKDLKLDPRENPELYIQYCIFVTLDRMRFMFPELDALENLTSKLNSNISQVVQKLDELKQ